MRVIEIHERFGLDRLTVAQRDTPRPGPGQVQLRMRAASLNYRDLLMVRGEYNPRQPLPLIPLSDGVGEVVATGDDVRRVAVGDRVIPLFAPRWIAGPPTRERMRATLGGPLDGTLCEVMVLDAEGVVRAPEHLDDVEAACLPCAALTAWSALTTHGALQAGQTVLIQGTGGVATFALQLSVALGARALVVSSEERKLEHARALGADGTINYREEPAWGRPIKQMAGGDGVDLVIDVGGGETLAQSLAAVRPGGRICSIGIVAGRTANLELTPLFMRQIRLQGVFVGNRDELESMNRAIEIHRLRPVVAETHNWTDAARALERLAAGEHIGKIGLTID